MNDVTLWNIEGDGEPNFSEPAICEYCSMKERPEWALSGKHVCDRITDPDYPAGFIVGQVLKIGKKRFVKII